MSNIITNLEFYKDKLVELGNDVAIVNGVVCKCSESNCTNCIACDSGDLIQWFLKPYQDPTHVLTRKERQLCELVEKGYIARDVEGWLYVYKQKPHKEGSYWNTDSEDYFDLFEMKDVVQLDFSFIKWEDEEPWSIEELLKLKVVE